MRAAVCIMWKLEDDLGNVCFWHALCNFISEDTILWQQGTGCLTLKIYS